MAGLFVPLWLVLSLVAVIIAVVVRLAFARLGGILPFPLLTYLGVGILVAGAIDLLWFDR